MKLYELPAKMAQLMDRYVDPETGELMDEEQFDKEIALLEMQADDVYEYISLQIKNELAEGEAIKQEIERLTKRMKVKQNAANRKLDYMTKYFQRDRFETARVKISWSKSTSLWIDPDLDPMAFYYEHEADDRFVRHKETFEWNKAQITKMVKENGGLDAEAFKLVENKKLKIK